MNIDTWCVERLNTTMREYEQLKAAGMDTIGDVKEALNQGAQVFAERVRGKIETAQKLAKQIDELEGGKEITEPPAPAGDAPDTSNDARPYTPMFAPPPNKSALRGPRTLDELKSYQEDIITPEIAANILGCGAPDICNQAQVDAGALGFPVIVLCGEVKIPRRGFIHFMEYGHTGGGGKN